MGWWILIAIVVAWSAVTLLVMVRFMHNATQVRDAQGDFQRRAVSEHYRKGE